MIFLLSDCGTLTYNAATGRQEFIAVSTPQEISMGQGIHQNLLKEYKLSTDAAKQERIRRIGQKVAQVSDRQDYAYNFYLVEKNELNAFTTPGGNIYFFTGLLEKFSRDDQIAAVLAHEIGHCAARHTIKKFQAAVSYNLLEQIIFSQLGLEAQAQRLASLSSGVISNLVFSAYSRQDELQADHLGVKYLRLAGYDVQAMIQTLEILKKESKGPKVPAILLSHPHIDDRIAAVQKEMASVAP